ncbi:MAG: efflux RND transporter periplasmic adaptor subunit [Pseudomonadota bacterium]|nr:efflux RND transporter periplasmic adaptor subunit [Pseudomonadota bacterium]
MNTPSKRFLLIVLAVGAAGALVWAFIAGHAEVAAEAEREKPVQAPTRVHVINGENVVSLDEPTRTDGGIVLATLTAISDRPRVRAYGTVLDVGGLTDLRNTLATANAQLSKARAALEVAQQDYARVKSLYDKNENVSQRVLQAAGGTLRAQESNTQAARAAVSAAQATALQQWGRVIATWLMQAAPQLERLRLQEDLLVQVTLPVGQTLTDIPPEATVQAAEGPLVRAQFISVASRTDRSIQGRSFFYRVVSANSASLLPGMNVVAFLPLGNAVQGVLAPGSAAVWLQGKPWIYVQIQPDQFARREVSTDQPAPDGWFQSHGFSAGQRFVATGAQVLLSEEFRAQITMGEEGH